MIKLRPGAIPLGHFVVHAVCLTLSLMIAHSPAQAEERQALSLDQAITIAIQHNPTYKTQQSRIGLNDANIITASMRINPSLMSDSGIAEYTYRLSGIQQTFELGGKRVKRVALAKAQKDSTIEEIRTDLLDLRSRVRQAYTQLYYAQASYWIFEDIVANTEKFLQVAQKREQAGDISMLEVMQASIQVLNAKNDLQAQQGLLTQAQNDLNAVLNYPMSTQLILETPPLFPQLDNEPPPAPPGALQAHATMIPSLSLDDLVARAFAHRPELKKNNADRIVAQRQLELAKANRIPNFQLTVGPDMVTTPPKGIAAFIMTNIDIPVFDRQQGPIQAALVQQKLVSNEEEALKNQIRREVHNAYNALVTSQNRIIRFETELIPMARQVREKSTLSFKEGKSSVLLPLVAQNTYISTQQGHLQALQDLQNAITDLEKSIGSGL